MSSRFSGAVATARPISPAFLAPDDRYKWTALVISTLGMLMATLFAAFLGYNPIQHLVGTATLSHLPAAQRAALLGHGFFPMLISAPFRSGLHAALDFAIFASLLAAVASWTRGKRYFHSEPTGTNGTVAEPAESVERAVVLGASGQ